MLPYVLDPNAYAFTALEVVPALDERRNQRMREGVPVWSVAAVAQLVGPDRPQLEAVTVRIVSPSRPAVPARAEVAFESLTVRPWQLDGRSGVSWSADAVRVVDAPPTRPAGKLATPAGAQ